MTQEDGGAVPKSASVHLPKQERSRRSFEQVRKAVLQIVSERQDGSFSVADVSSKAGVSVGTIYNRVSGKAELIRLVQAEEFAAVDRDMERRLGEARAFDGDIVRRVEALVRAFADGLRDNAPVLTPFFALSKKDEVLMARGVQSSRLHARLFIDVLREVLEEHRRAIERAELVWTHELVFSTLARHLDFGVPISALAEENYSWDELLERLCATALRYLSIP